MNVPTTMQVTDLGRPDCAQLDRTKNNRMWSEKHSEDFILSRANPWQPIPEKILHRIIILRLTTWRSRWWMTRKVGWWLSQGHFWMTRGLLHQENESTNDWFPWISHVLGVNLLDSLILQVQVPINIPMLSSFSIIFVLLPLTHSYRCVEGLIHFFMILLGCWRASTWIDQVKLRRTLLWKGHLAAWKLHGGRGHVSCATFRASMQ